MPQQQQQIQPEDGPQPPPSPDAQQQQQPQPVAQGHAGQGSDSVMKQLREWEQRRRGGHSGGERRQGPG